MIDRYALLDCIIKLFNSNVVIVAVYIVFVVLIKPGHHI